MSQITGAQIADKSVGFNIFSEDENGLIQLPSNIQLNGNDLATKGDLDDVSGGSANSAVYEKITPSALGKYSISQSPSGDVVVYVNGLAQVPDDDYSMNGQTIEFTNSPNATDVVTASYIV